MTAATILIPTHNHVRPLAVAIESALAQSVADFELFIVGDGVSQATRAVATKFADADRRVRFFDFPKGPRKGEVHRHVALQQARGRFVAYLGDDDAWFPNHLEVLGEVLNEVDFGHTMQIGINSESRIVMMAADLQNPDFRARMLTTLFNRFDLTFAGHTLAAYHRLPHGWITTPPDFPWTDLYMWRQFLSQSWCRARSVMVPTGINTWTHLRPNLTDEERAKEMIAMRDGFAEPGMRELLWRTVATLFAKDAVAAELRLSSPTPEVA
jgi:GalNAc5-diNAcBac-PP-undecaprenol beta-1,3-glucosyltransferase